MNKKQEIDFAISIMAFVLYGDYDAFMYLCDDEQAERMNEHRKRASMFIRKHNISDKEIEKHFLRSFNEPNTLIRFIDKPHFIAIDPDKLPF